MMQVTAKISGHNARKPGFSTRIPWPRRSHDSKPPVLLLYNLDRTWSESDLQDVLTAVNKLESALIAAGHSITSRAVHRDVEAVIRDFDPAQHIVFNWCDGLEGDPKAEHVVPLTLEALGFSYTGADAQALLISQDKWRVKSILQRRHIPTPRGRIFRRPEAKGWDHFPAIVKPVGEHCSFGITREAVVDSPQELERRVTYVLETFNQPALVEDFIDGREFHVAVWGNGRPQVLPLAEMDFSAFGDLHDRLCTYESKWNPESLPYRLINTLCPAPVDEELKTRIEATAVTAYRALGCRDYGRMDIRVRDGVCYVLDVNPNPDICDDGSFALAAEVAGFSYAAMASHIVTLAAKRCRFT